MVGHKFDRSGAIFEDATDVKVHSQRDNELGQKQIELVKSF